MAASRSSSDRSRSRSTSPPRSRASSAEAGALVPFRPSLGEVVLGWVTSDDEARRWASLSARPTSPDLFARWHATPGVRPYVFGVDGTIVAYGEIWEDPDEGEAELARLIVQPERRGQGIGRWLVRQLLAEARRLGWTTVWLRVMSDNEPAIRAYTAAGFRRASPDKEAAFNVGQPAAYIWMRAPGSSPR